ncbi:MAG TPA: biotin-dependent carboxyltransferase family protein [Chiayiivirga sp.]|nr:biotin-dependent carboxyltransferase family protein [Chiayiivirga sp.]
MSITVLAPGFMTSLQDAGRPGLMALGVGASGAFDSPALRLANALCGNAVDACGLELTLIGPRLRFERDTRFAVTGAPLALELDGVARPMWSPLQAGAGSTLTFGRMATGCRSYLAVAGGLRVEPVLGSRSSDLNSKLGPLQGRPLCAGDRLPLADEAAPPWRHAPSWSLNGAHWFDFDEQRPLRLLPGAHRAGLTRDAIERLFTQGFTVANDSNRVGLRLVGPALTWKSPMELVSAGSIPGVLQLPPSGQPIAFGPEAPVSGGYPRIGQIAAVDFPRLAQARPGDRLRFVACELNEALAALHTRELALARVIAAVAARLS